MLAQQMQFMIPGTTMQPVVSEGSLPSDIFDVCVRLPLVARISSRWPFPSYQDQCLKSFPGPTPPRR